MSQTNINFLKFSFEKAIEQHSTNISSLMKQFEQIITRAQEISEENTRLKRKVIIFAGRTQQFLSARELSARDCRRRCGT